MSEANLKIIAYGKPDGPKEQNKIDEFVVVFNPSSFTIKNRIQYQWAEAKGRDGGDPVFEKIPPIEFSIDFTIDGTGASMGNQPESNRKDYLKNQVKKLRYVTGCGINGDIHRTNYLVLLWGTFYIPCVLTSLNITYNLFDRNGSPLRAKVNCGFLERIGPGKGERETRLESPDLTKYVTTREGDLLPLIVKDKYNDPAYYLQVAKINKLKNFRNIPPGKRLILPPMKEHNED